MMMDIRRPARGTARRLSMSSGVRGALGGVTLAVAIGLLLPVPAGAETIASLQSTYYRWALEGKEVTQVFTHLHLGTDVHQFGYLDVSTGHAVVNSSFTDIDGLVDTKLRYSIRPRKHLALTLGVNGPTGQKELSLQSYPTVSVVTDRLLLLPTRVLGRGTDFTVGASWAPQIGSGITLGLGVSALITGAFTPYADGREYQPGNRLSVVVGVDIGGPVWLWRTNLRYLEFGTDQLGGEDFAQNGNVADLSTQLVRRWRRTTGRAEIAYIRIGDPKPLQQGLTDETLNARTENEIGLTVGFEHWLRKGWRLDGRVRGRYLTGNEAEEGESRSLELFAQTLIQVMSRLWIQFGGGVGSATLEEPVTDLELESGSTLEGVSLTLGLRSSLGFGR